MRNTLKSAALAAIAALGMLAAMPASAQAEGIYFGFGDGGPRFGIHAGDGYRDRDGWRGRHGRDHRRHGRRDDWRDGRPRCSPQRALAKAERLGLRRVRLRDIDRRTIRVSGRRHGDRITVTFARSPSCPVVGF